MREHAPYITFLPPQYTNMSEKQEMTWDWLIHHKEDIPTCDGSGDTDTLYFLTGKESPDDEYGLFDSALDAAEALVQILSQRARYDSMTKEELLADMLSRITFENKYDQRDGSWIQASLIFAGKEYVATGPDQDRAQLNLTQIMNNWLEDLIREQKRLKAERQVDYDKSRLRNLLDSV